MAGKIEIVGTLNDADIIRSLVRQQGEIAKSTQALARMAQQGGQTGSKVKGGADSVTQSMGKLAQSVLGIGSVSGALLATIRTIKDEMERINRLRKESAGAQVGVAAAQKAAIENIGTTDQREIDRLNQAAERMAGRGIQGGRAAAYSVLGTVASFKSADQSLAEAFEAAEIASEQFPESKEAAEQQAKAILTLQPHAKGSMRDIAGFTYEAKALTPTVTAASFAENIAPAIADLAQLGATPQEAVGLLGTIGKGASDEEGRITRTAAVNFARQIKMATPQMKGATLGERLAFIQSEAGAETRAGLLGFLEQQEGFGTTDEKGSLTGEAKAFMTEVGLLQGGDTAQKRMYAAGVAATPRVAGSARIMDETLAAIRKEPWQILADADRRAQAAIEAREIEDFAGGLAGQATKIREETEAKVNFPGPDWLTPGAASEEALREGIRFEGQYGPEDRGGPMTGPEASRFVMQQQAQSFPKGSIERELYEKQIKTLDALVETQKQLNESLQRNTEATRANTASGSIGTPPVMELSRSK